jgi:hypothetical protein
MALLDPLVDPVADVPELVVGERSAVGEVEAELVGATRGARLAHVRPEALPERRVQEVRRGVVPHRREAGDVVDLGLDPSPGVQPVHPALQLDRLVVPDPVDVGDGGGAALPPENPRVGDLSAALGVEGALLELDERPAVVRLGGEHTRLGLELLVADKPARRRGRGKAEHGAMVILGAMGGRRSHPGPRPLLLHQLLEALVVDGEALLRQQLLGQVVREAVGVVELEGVGSVDP